jgi:hypothetical protein
MSEQSNAEDEQCVECDDPAEWHWWNGKGVLGKYCEEHARERLDTDIPKYKDPITLESMAGMVRPAGLIPADSAYPVIRHRTLFDMWLAYNGGADN